MSKDVTDLLVDGQNELSAQLERVRSQMAEEHKLLGERVAKLEAHQKMMMWVTAPAGVVVGMVLREVISKWI